MKTFHDAFKLLDQWRHLPSYRLEPRVDVFFALYLKDFLEEKYKAPLMDTVIPELPLKKVDDNRSNKVDFVFLSQDRKIAYFVEIKTDKSSRREIQDEYLRAAKKDGFRKVVENLKQVSIRSGEYRRKYYYLLNLLEQTGLIALPSTLSNHIFPKYLRGLTSELTKIEVKPFDPKIQIVYVQPHDEKIEDAACISFSELSTHLDRCNDELSLLLASYLREWQTLPASKDPNPQHG